ncbi:MAG: insulinase family protein [Planctomycetota bacterium]|nr:MAG: insulinase family protein [Planctomycetota bacterium]
MKSLESAAFTFLVPVGSSVDPADRAGLSSFTGELALRGCGTRDSRQFVEDLENLGVERGEAVSVSHTSFSGATLSANLPPALSIYADLLRRPRFPADQLEAARLVVLQELLAIEDEPAQKLMIELRKHQYPDPWGRSSQGEEATLRQIGLDEIKQHHQGQYRPNGTILGVAGNFEWPQLRDLVGRLFEDWQPREVPDPATGAAPDKHAHLEHESNQTHIGVAYEGLPYRHPDYFQAWGAVGVLSGGMSSRLFTEVREKRGLCYSVFATMHTLRDRASVLCYAGTSAERAQETLDVTLAELGRIAEGIRPDELARLKARIKSGLIMQQESSIARSGSIARDWYHLGRTRTLDELGQIIDGLTCESINAYLAAHPPGDFTVVTLGPKPLEVHLGVS